MNASNLLQSALRPRNFSSSPRRPVNSPKRNRKVSSKLCTASENVVPAGGSIHQNALPATQRCLCSPTTHPGSFRCRLHRASKAHPSTCSTATPATKVQPKQTLSGKEPVIPSSMKVPPVDKVVRRAVASPLGSTNCQTPRKFEAKPSRLSKVVMAADPEKGIFSSTEKVTKCRKPLAIFGSANDDLL